MAKRKKPPIVQEITLQNPVAKFMNRFNKSATHADKKHYQRHAKHKGREPLPMHCRLHWQRLPFYGLFGARPLTPL